MIGSKQHHITRVPFVWYYLIMAIAKQDLEKKLAEVMTRLDQLEVERTALIKRREIFTEMMAEFFGGDAVRKPTVNTNINRASLNSLQIADAIDLVIPEGQWHTARSLTSLLNERGKVCEFKAVKLALERNKGKRYDCRNTGALIEWQKLAKLESQTGQNGNHAPVAGSKIVNYPATNPTIPDRAEAVMRTRGPIYIKDLFAEMRSQGWQGTGNDDNDRNTLLSTLSTRKQRFKNLGGNVWDVAATSNTNAANGTLFTH
jgi:hypothetical protein